MALRIKSRWPERRRSAVSDEVLAENGTALAFISWRLALEYARNIHGEGFDYASDRERVGVITEYVAFFIQCADRLAHARLADEERAVFIRALATGLVEQVQDNLTDLAGPADYRNPFIALLNQRGADYSGLGFDQAPGYDFLRYFGQTILGLMGETQTNRWVIDQIMDIDGPGSFEKFRGALANLLDTSLADRPAPGADA